MILRKVNELKKKKKTFDDNYGHEKALDAETDGRFTLKTGQFLCDERTVHELLKLQTRIW